MTDEQFQERLDSLRKTAFGEDFVDGICHLYQLGTSAQRNVLRDEHKAGLLSGPKSWRNPTDFSRSDLTLEQRARQSLIRKSISGAGRDFRDDLCGIAWCYHNLALAGADADSALLEVAQMSDSVLADLIRGFVQRPEEGKSLGAFRLKIVQTPNGPIVDSYL